jgi:hypothetical protein
VAFAAKPGTKLASYFVDHPPLGAKLSPDLPQADCWAAGWYSMNSEKISGAVSDLLGFAAQAFGALGSALPGQAGAETAKMQAMYGKLQTLLQTHPDLVSGRGAMLALTGSTGGLFNVIGAQQVKEANAYRTLMEDTMKIMKDLTVPAEAGTPAGAPGSAMSFSLSYERDVQKVGDLSLDRLKETFALPASPPGQPNPAAILKGFFGGDGLTVWYAFTDGYAYMQMGPTPDRIADLVKTAKDGGGIADDPALAALRKHTLAESNVVAFVSISHLTNLMLWNVMSAISGAPVPPLDPAAARNKSAVSAAAGQGRVAMEIYMPAGEVKQLATTVMGFVQMIQRQTQQQMPGAQGELQKGRPGGPGTKTPAAINEGDAVTSPPEDELCPETTELPGD